VPARPYKPRDKAKVEVLVAMRFIARAVGYAHSHFTAVFTRHMGMTPSMFRDVLQR
jgi:hypothetical protein